MPTMTDNDPTLFDDPPPEPRAHARRTNPHTSHMAAASIAAPQLRESQQAVRDVLALRGPLDDTDLIEWYAAYRTTNPLPAQSPSGIRSRRAELVALGIVHDTGRRAELISGRKSIIWGLVQ